MVLARRARPPGGVRFAALMIGLGAFFSCALGLLMLLIHLDQATLQQAQITRGMVQLVGFILLVIGLLEFLLIYALWGRQQCRADHHPRGDLHRDPGRPVRRPERDRVLRAIGARPTSMPSMPPIPPPSV